MIIWWRAYHHTYGLPTLITNSSNNYGPYQFPEKLIPLMCVNMLLGKPPCPFMETGRTFAIWVFVEDHCRAISAVLTQAEPGAALQCGRYGRDKKPRFGYVCCVGLWMSWPRTYPSARPRISLPMSKIAPVTTTRYAMNISKIRSELGWQPQYSLQDGLRQTVTWYLNHPDWWMPLLSEEYQTYYRKIYGEG